MMFSDTANMETIKKLTSREARMYQLRSLYRKRTKSSHDIYSSLNDNSNEHSKVFESSQQIVNAVESMHQLLGNENR